jgi:hypothetical protein
MLEETGMMTCPVVVAGGQVVGGLAGTDRAAKSGRLRELPKAA